MTNALTTNQNTRAGLCPHGLPPAACPICSAGGMSGGIKKDTPPMKTNKSNEWSWLKCYAVGVSMKAQENRIQNAKTAFEKEIEFAKQLHKNIQNILDRINNSISELQKTMPKAIQNTLQIISNYIINPFFNIVLTIPKLIEKLATLQQNLQGIIQQASEKLSAILGDIKNFLNENIVQNLKRRFKKLFFFITTDIEDDNYKNDETLAVFKAREIKKYIIKIVNEIKKRDEDANRSIKSKYAKK